MNCHRCEGKGTQVVPADTDDEGRPLTEDVVEISCGRCGGSKREPDPLDLMERRYMYGGEE